MRERHIGKRKFPVRRPFHFVGKPAGYCIVFGYCAVAYIVGWCIMKSLVPHYKKVEL